MPHTSTFVFGSRYCHFSGQWSFDDAQTGFAIQRLADGLALRLTTRLAVERVVRLPFLLSDLRVDTEDATSPVKRCLGMAFDRNVCWVSAG